MLAVVRDSGSVVILALMKFQFVIGFECCVKSSARIDYLWFVV